MQIWLPQNIADFNPFNLITVTGDQAWVHSNRPDEARTLLGHGIHGLSNGPVDQPWPKSPHLNDALEQWIAKETDDPAMLLDCLSDKNTYEPKGRSVPSSQTELEPAHSPIFIANPTYGTRCSTVVAVDHSGNGVFIERRFAPSGVILGEMHLPFSWSIP